MKKEIKVGMFFLIAVLIFVFVLIKVKRLDFFNEHYELITYFANTNGISKGTPVLLSGLKVGYVDRLEQLVQNNKIKVVLSIKVNYKIRKDAVAQIKLDNIMGQKKVSLTFGTSKSFLNQYEVIKSKEQIDLDKIINKVDTIANKAGSLIVSLNKNQDKVLNKIYDMLDENQTNVKEFISNINSIVKTNKPKFNRILKYLDKTMPSVMRSMENIEKITLAIKNNEGTLGLIINKQELYNNILESVKNIKKSFKNINEVVSENRSDVRVIVKNLKTTLPPIKKSFDNISVITEKIKNGDGSLGKLVNDTGLYHSANKAIRKISDSLEDQREQSIMSNFTGTLLDIFKF